MAEVRKGLLDAGSLQEILALLAEGDRTWSLIVSDGASEKIVYFSIGGIRMVAQGGRSGRGVADILASRGRLSPKRRERITEHAKNKNVSFSEAASELEMIPRDDLEEASRLQLQEELCDLAFWRDAEFDLQEGQPPPQFYEIHERACNASCDIPEFVQALRQRLTRLEDIHEKIGSDFTVYSLTHDGTKRLASGRDAALCTLLGLVDGKRRLRDILQAAKVPAVNVFESIHELLEDKFITKSGASAEGAGQSRDEIQAEIDRLEASRAGMVSDVIVRKRLVRLYEEIGEKSRAAMIWREISGIHYRKNDLRGTLTALREAARCEPSAFGTRERILDLLRELGETSQMVDEGRRLAELLFKSNLLNRARRTLEKLLNFAPHDIALRKLYALTLLGLEKEDLALLELRRLATLLEKAGAPKEELREVYRRILALDSTDKLWRKKLRGLTVNPRMKLLTALGFAAAAVFLLLGGGGFLYETAARRSFSKEEREVQRLLEENRFEAARKKIRSLRDRFPLTTVSRRGADLLNRIDAWESDYLRRGLRADIRAAERAERAGEADKAAEIYRRVSELDPETDQLVLSARERLARILAAEESAKKLVDRAASLDRKGQLTDAIRIYNEVRALYPSSEAARSIRYPSRVRTVPAGARVFLNGVEVKGEAPYLVHYSLAEKSRLRAELPGFSPLLLNLTEPLGADEVIYLAKEPLWSFTGAGPFEGAPILRRDELYIAGRDRNLYALSLADGSLRFTTSLGIFGDCGGAVAAGGPAVLVGTARGDLLAVDSMDGAELWRRRVGESIASDIGVDEEAGLAYVLETGGRLTALDLYDGQVKWEQFVETAPGAAPVPGGGQVFVGSYDGRWVAAFDAEEGERSWIHRLRAPAAGTPSYHEGRLCFSAESGTLFLADAATGEEQARLRTGSTIRSRPAMDGDDLFVAGLDGKIYRYLLGSGLEMAWVSELDEVVLGAPAVSEASVYVGTVDGRLFSLDRETGEIQWAFGAGGKIVSRPVVRDGVVYVATMAGRVFAIPE